MTRSIRGNILIEASTAIQRPDEFIFVEVAPWKPMATGPEPVTGRIADAHGATVRGDFAGSPTPTSGHLPLPTRSDVRRLVQGWGAHDGRRVVLYTRRVEEFSSATRAWFTLGWAGFTNVVILDGALPAWAHSGGELHHAEIDRDSRGTRLAESTVSTVGTVSPHGDNDTFTTLTAEDVMDISRYGTLLDGRDREVFNGFIGEPRSGHVPHAQHAPADELLDADGRLLPDNALRRWFLHRQGLGGHTIGAYCGGGVSSSALVFAGAVIGQRIGLYVDSWSAWQHDDSLPVQRGEVTTRSGDVDTDCQ